MFSYRITTNVLSTGDATMSIKLLKTKICSESLKLLLLKISLEGFSLNILSVFDWLVVACSFQFWCVVKGLF